MASFDHYKMIDVQVQRKVAYAYINNQPINLITRDLLDDLVRLSNDLAANPDLLVVQTRCVDSICHQGARSPLLLSDNSAGTSVDPSDLCSSRKEDGNKLRPWWSGLQQDDSGAHLTPALLHDSASRTQRLRPLGRVAAK